MLTETRQLGYLLSLVFATTIPLSGQASEMSVLGEHAAEYASSQHVHSLIADNKQNWLDVMPNKKLYSVAYHTNIGSNVHGDDGSAEYSWKHLLPNDHDIHQPNSYHDWAKELEHLHHRGIWDDAEDMKDSYLHRGLEYCTSPVHPVPEPQTYLLMLAGLLGLLGMRRMVGTN